MDRKWLQEQFEKIGSRLTIRRGLASRTSPLRLNVATDRHGEHFTLTIDPACDEKDIEIRLLDINKKLRHMLLFIDYPKARIRERLMCGHDEMHWFVAGVTESTNLKQAFERLRPSAVTVAMQRAGVKLKNQNKRKNKGFTRQGEWFFVPVHFQEDGSTIIHKNEPISRTGGTPHYVDEVIRIGGKVVYVRGDQVITESQYKRLSDRQRVGFNQRVRGARVLGRGKVKHRDHHTIELRGWHEIHLSNESGVSTNAFID